MIPMCSKRWKIFFDKMKLSGCSAGEMSASHDFDLIASEFQSSSDPILLNGNSYWSELKSVQARDHKIPFPYFCNRRIFSRFDPSSKESFFLENDQQ